MSSITVIRSLTSASVMLSGVVHLVLWAQGMSGLSVVGPAFLVNAVAGLALGVLVQLWDHWLPLLASAGFGAATLGAFVLSTTVGFFGVHEQWRGPAVWLAAVSEALAIALGAVGAWRVRLEGRGAAGGSVAAEAAHRPGSRA
ncbi:hypothetical protein OEB99_13135 [Actinotalea sp. M2MS4P-6]|uniref:hypothetical protein n=1 Tax=Actinotalea sp. M2MS4P-6 TaxID=2983762 RepID=UPI0021E35FFC|nr:hypothetical protein [Actinotalea sp. M2MS4P-6]MCV2395256.1 hypothetical protein [Actinotalea sp. M2MS4P-6]